MTSIQKFSYSLTFVIVAVSFLALFACTELPKTAGSNSRADQFMRACASKNGLSPVYEYQVRSFGADAKSSSFLISLIASGSKTGTFTTPWLYEREPNNRPMLGGYTVVTEFDGTPKLVLRTMSLELLTFETVTEAQTHLESPSARSVQAWRDIHWGYFTRVLSPYGVKPQMSMPVVAERFDVVCP